MNELQLICLVVVELERALDRMLRTTCGATAMMKGRPAADVICTKIKGHTSEDHSDGCSTWG